MRPKACNVPGLYSSAGFFKNNALFLSIFWSKISGVAWVSCVLGQEIFLRSPSIKAAEFEVKNCVFG